MAASTRLRPCSARSRRTSSHRPVENWRIIHLGDYVDRGADSRGVVEFLVRLESNSARPLPARQPRPDVRGRARWPGGGGPAVADQRRRRDARELWALGRAVHGGPAVGAVRGRRPRGAPGVPETAADQRALRRLLFRPCRNRPGARPRRAGHRGAALDPRAVPEQPGRSSTPWSCTATRPSSASRCGPTGSASTRAPSLAGRSAAWCSRAASKGLLQGGRVVPLPKAG